MRLNDITGAIIETAIDIHRRLGQACSNRSIEKSWRMNCGSKVWKFKRSGRSRLYGMAFKWRLASGLILSSTRLSLSS